MYRSRYVVTANNVHALAFLTTSTTTTTTTTINSTALTSTGWAKKNRTFFER